MNWWRWVCLRPLQPQHMHPTWTRATHEHYKNTKHKILEPQWVFECCAWSGNRTEQCLFGGVERTVSAPLCDSLASILSVSLPFSLLCPLSIFFFSSASCPVSLPSSSVLASTSVSQNGATTFFFLFFFFLRLLPAPLGWYKSNSQKIYPLFKRKKKQSTFKANKFKNVLWSRYLLFKLGFPQAAAMATRDRSKNNSA